jgi:hypothetical protein
MGADTPVRDRRFTDRWQPGRRHKEVNETLAKHILKKYKPATSTAASSRWFKSTPATKKDTSIPRIFAPFPKEVE